MTETTTTSEATTVEAPEAPVSELVAFKRKVWTLALQTKAREGWCESGFNEGMDELGLPHFPGLAPEEPYEPYNPVPYVRRQRTRGRRRPGSLECGDSNCTLCYFPLVGEEQYAETEEEFNARVAEAQAQYDAAVAEYEKDKADYQERRAAWDREHSAEALIN